MGSVYQRGELAGLRKALTRQLTKRFGERAGALVARLQLADEPALDSVADLLAERLSDEEVLARIGEVLSKSDEATEEDEAE